MTELFGDAAVAEKPAVKLANDGMRDIVPAQSQAPAVVQSQDDRLLEKVLEGGNIEVLERYIALRKSEEERQAKLAFDEHFAAMQKDYVPVYKSKDVFDDNNKKMYSFCALENIVDVYAPILSKHGFSYFWDEETIDDKNKRIWCHICGYGHERKGYVDVAIQMANKYGNAIQQRGVSSSYGQRYSLKNALGIVERNADTDGSFTLLDMETAEPYKRIIENCTTRAELIKAFGPIWKDTEKNRRVQTIIRTAFDVKKKELTA